METLVSQWEQCQSYSQHCDLVQSSFRPHVSRVLQGDAAGVAEFRRKHVDLHVDVLFLCLEAIHDLIVDAGDPMQDLPRKRGAGPSSIPDFHSAAVHAQLWGLLQGLKLPDALPEERFACRNLFAFREAFQKCARSQGKKRLRAEGNDVTKFFTLKLYKRAFTRAWSAFLSLPLSDELKLAVLRALPEAILPHVSQAWAFSDFLSNTFDLGGLFSIYALQGLFILMTKHNLDYPQFYDKLYSLFTVDMLHSKFRSRFLDLLGLLMTSTRLPAYLVASFIKKASRMTLVAPTPTLNFLIVIIYNLLKSHPEAMVLIHRTKAMDLKVTAHHTPEALAMLRGLYEGLDPFNDAETNLQKTNALYSSCWELKLLQNHFYPGIAVEADAFQQEMKVQSQDWKPHSGKTYLKMFLKEMGRFDAKKSAVACTYHDATGLFD
eukprot:EG_transcript_13264